MTAPLKLALSSGPGNGAGAGMRYVAGLVLFTLWCCVTRWLRCAALLTCSSAALASRSRDHTQEIASSFPVPFVSFSRSSHFVFCHSPSPFSPPSPSCSRRISTLSCPPWAVGSASQANQVWSPFSFLRLPAARLAVAFQPQRRFIRPKTDDLFAPPRVRDSLSLFNSARAAVH